MARRREEEEARHRAQELQWQRLRARVARSLSRRRDRPGDVRGGREFGRPQEGPGGGDGSGGEDRASGARPGGADVIVFRPLSAPPPETPRMTNSRRADGEDPGAYSPRPPVLRRPVGTPRGRDQRDERGEVRDPVAEFSLAMSVEQVADDHVVPVASLSRGQPDTGIGAFPLRRLTPAAPLLSPVHSVGRLEQTSSVGDPEDRSRRGSDVQEDSARRDSGGAPGWGLLAAMPAPSQPVVTRQSTAPAASARGSGPSSGTTFAVSGPPPARAVRRSMGPLARDTAASGLDTPVFPGVDFRDAS